MRSPVMAWSWARSSAASSVTSSARSRAPADLDVEGLLCGEVRVPSLHGGDHIVDRPALEGVHGGRPGMVEMAQLRVPAAQFELLAVLQLERHPALRGRENLRRPAVDEPEPGIVARPADAVAGAQLDALSPVDLAAATAPADLSRLPGHLAAVTAFQHHLPGLVINADNAALVALLDADPLVGTVERHHVAHRVVGGKSLLGVGVALRDQAFTLHDGAVDAALAGQALADMPVDLLAERVARRHDAGVLALLLGQPQPARGHGAGDIVGLHLGDIAAELVEGAMDLALEARHHRLLQRRIALAHDLVHHGGLHAGGLELGEGLAGVHGVELLGIADQHHARDTEFVGNPEQVAGLHGGSQRSLVDHQDGLCEGGAHLLRALLREPSLGDAGIAREEALEGLALDAGLGRQRLHRRGRRR